jgi:hypothetical protein
MTVRLAAALVALAVPALSEPPASLDKIRDWPIYDERASAAIDFADLCRLARLPCAAVVAPGEKLAAPAGPVAGKTVGVLLDRLLKAHPGYKAEMRSGVLALERKKDACAAALSKLTPKAHLRVVTARVAALMTLRASGWASVANAQINSLSQDTEDARYQNVELIVYDGVTVRRALDRIALGDGRMIWTAESDGKTCKSFRFSNWREPQPVSGPSVLISVTAKDP